MDQNDAFEEVIENYKVEDFNLDLIKSKIPSHNSQKLCEMIVCTRYFGLNPDLDIYCMEELAKRRINGDIFDFESKIEEIGKELPPLDFSDSGFDIRKILTAAIGNK